MLTFRYRDNKSEMFGNLVFPLEVPASIPNEAVEPVKKIIDNMNIVLQQLIPGLTITSVDLGPVISKEGNIARLVQLMSLKNGKEIPFRYESTI